MWHLKDWATNPGRMLTVQQKMDLAEAMSIVGRTQLPLCAHVCLQCHCCTMELHRCIRLMPLQCKAV